MKDVNVPNLIAWLFVTAGCFGALWFGLGPIWAFVGVAAIGLLLLVL